VVAPVLLRHPDRPLTHLGRKALPRLLRRDPIFSTIGAFTELGAVEAASRSPDCSRPRPPEARSPPTSRARHLPAAQACLQLAALSFRQLDPNRPRRTRRW
jgi:hypothetical protein